MEKQSKIKGDNNVKILGVGVNSTSMDQVLRKIDEICRSSLKKPMLAVTVNPELVMLAQEDKEFKEILNGADLALPDGAGLRWAAPDLPEIIPGRKIVEQLQNKGYRMFFLGGREGAAEKMMRKSQTANPKSQYAFDSGHENIKLQLTNAQINDRLIKKINSFGPDILLVAYGAPWQEKWLWSIKGRVKAKVMMGVGGTFDYLAGRAKLPPAWVEKAGLEWLWRLAHEPWRWRRQLKLVEFVYLVMKERLGKWTD